MKTMALVFLVIAAFISSWTICAASSCEDEDFTVYENPNSTDVNRYIREMANKLMLDLQDNLSLKLNETAIKDIPAEVYLALVVKGSSSTDIVKVKEVKNLNKDSSESADCELFDFDC